ncbi:hypothetical protein O1611_g4453 [Lasiodiplodia mahajangana]|uniref:Uncharacterized protein n=1 Tax=Lasiodiplodia mahajangana TaxID=1108764 RepID=A0ACC2JNZ7_9PEZI|nr:hypothetical protein O1611_g4453 [Lasiodiplodia mahajangana]
MADYPPGITASEGARLTEVTKDWALAHGLTVRPPPAVIAAEVDPQSILATAVPVTLFPSPFPKVCFEQGIAVQKAYNELYASISQDEDFLARMVQEIGDSDDFITELWKVHLRVKAEGYVQVCAFMILNIRLRVNQIIAQRFRPLQIGLYGPSRCDWVWAPDQTSRVQYHRLILRRSLISDFAASQVSSPIPSI